MKIIATLLCVLPVFLNAQRNYLILDGLSPNYVVNERFKELNGAKEFTVEFMIRYKKSFTDPSGLLLFGKDRSASYLAVVISPSNAIEVWVRGKDDAVVIVESIEPLAENKWHSVAVVYNGLATDTDVTVQNRLVMKIFVDGKLTGSKTRKADSVFPANLATDMTGLRIGSSASPQNYCGDISSLKVWSKALNAELISEWMNREYDETHPLHDALICYYDMKLATEGLIKDTVNDFDLKFEGRLNQQNIVDLMKGDSFVTTLKEKDQDYKVFKLPRENGYTLSGKERDPFHKVVKERDPSELSSGELKTLNSHFADYKLTAVIKGRKPTCFFNKGKLKIGDVVKVKAGNRFIKVKVDRIKEKPLGVVFKAGSVEIVKEIKR